MAVKRDLVFNLRRLKNKLSCIYVYIPSSPQCVHFNTACEKTKQLFQIFKKILVSKLKSLSDLCQIMMNQSYLNVNHTKSILSNDEFYLFIYLFGALCRFQHYTSYIMTCNFDGQRKLSTVGQSSAL